MFQNSWHKEKYHLDPNSKWEYGAWTCANEYQDILCWYLNDSKADLPDETSWWIAATPDWNGDGKTDVCYQTSDGQDELMGTIDTAIFETFEDYAKAMEPFLNQGTSYAILYPPQQI